MIVVSDTSPINYLVQLGIIEILPQLFETVIIPAEVHRELTSTDTPNVVHEWISAPPDWLEIRQNSKLIITQKADPGETAAVALAVELQPDYIAVDDLKGRKIARANHLRIIGTVGIIELAYQEGLLDLQTTLDELLETNFHISKTIVQQVLDRNP